MGDRSKFTIHNGLEADSVNGDIHVTLPVVLDSTSSLDTSALTSLTVKGLTAPSGSHLALNTTSDDKQARINSRSFTQASGDSIGFQSKPSQTVTTTGSVQGGQISPRLQSGVAAGNIIGLHVDTDLKGTAAGNLTNDYVIEAEAVADVSGGRTISGDVAILKARLYLSASGGVSGDTTVLNVPAAESGSVPWDAFAKLAVDTGLAAKHTSAGAALPSDVGWIRVKIGDTFYKLPAYND